MLRLFFAINLPTDSRDRIATASQPLRDAAPSIAWVRAPLLHLTVKFLGAQDEPMLDSLAAAAERVSIRVRPTSLTFARYGAFPNLQRPRVVWLGMNEGADTLTRLALELDQECARLGIPPETRPFKAHLTLGRVKNQLPATERTALAHAAVRSQSQETVMMDRIELMRSDLGPGGPHYTALASATFGGA